LALDGLRARADDPLRRRRADERRVDKRLDTDAMSEEDEPTTEELKARVVKRAEENPDRAQKAKYLKEKLEERERSEREAGIDPDVPPEE
jgi:hypothetical protein